MSFYRSKSQRILYLAAVLISIILGLSSRKFGNLLPFFIAENAGDALWAVMVYYGFRFLLLNNKLSLSILFSFVFSFCIELSQLYQGHWINQLRSTLLGGLILGKGFLNADLLRYTVGIVTAFLIDKHILNRKLQ